MYVTAGRISVIIAEEEMVVMIVPVCSIVLLQTIDRQVVGVEGKMEKSFLTPAGLKVSRLFLWFAAPLSIYYR